MKLNDFLLILDPRTSQLYLAGEADKGNARGIVLNALAGTFFIALVDFVYSVFGGFMGNVVFALILFVATMAFGALLFVLLSAAQFAIARAMGGSGTPISHVYLLSLAFAGISPVAAILLLATLIPFFYCLTFPLLAVLFIFWLYLQALAVATAHKVAWGMALSIILLHLALIVGIGVAISVAVLAVSALAG